MHFKSVLLCVKTLEARELKMRLGRDWTNLLEYDYMDEKSKKKFLAGKLTVADMDATFQIKFKADIKRQVDKCIESGLNHVELDGGIPNPYLKIKADQLQEFKEYAASKDVTLSMHLPYTFTVEGTCGFQEADRKAAVKMQKKYIDAASKLGCKFAVMHPGSIPFYQATGKYLEISNKMLKKSLLELSKYAADKNVFLHLENNTKFDATLITPEDCLKMLEGVWSKGGQIKFCFDLAHTFTQCERTEDIPLPVEKEYEKIPDKYFYGIHIGDYVPEKKLFHPPINKEDGLIKRDTWKNIFRIFKRKGVKFIVIETAVREKDDLINGDKIQKDEASYVKKILDEVLAEQPS